MRLWVGLKKARFLALLPGQGPGDRLCLGPSKDWAIASTRGVILPAMDSVLLSPAIALIAGILILLMPRILNYVVAIYLIAIGIIGLLPQLQ